MKTIMAVLMLLISTSVLADRPVCPQGSTFPACVNANAPSPPSPPGLTETNVHLVPEPGTLALVGLGLIAVWVRVARKEKGNI
jgi:hypothetical protein